MVTGRAGAMARWTWTPAGRVSVGAILAGATDGIGSGPREVVPAAADAALPPIVSHQNGRDPEFELAPASRRPGSTYYAAS